MGNKNNQISLTLEQIQQINQTLNKPTIRKELDHTRFYIKTGHPIHQKMYSYIDHLLNMFKKQDSDQNQIELYFIHKGENYYHKSLEKDQVIQLRDLLSNLDVAIQQWNDDQNCSICSTNQIQVLLQCCHGLCLMCTRKWLQNKKSNECPICNKDLDDDTTLMIENFCFNDTDDQIKDLIVNEIFKIINII